MGTAAQAQRKVSDVLQDIAGNIQEIIRSEVLLAKVEVKEKAQKASKPAAILATGTILGLYGLGFLLLAAVYGLSLVLAPWLAALIVGADRISGLSPDDPAPLTALAKPRPDANTVSHPDFADRRKQKAADSPAAGAARMR